MEEVNTAIEKYELSVALDAFAALARGEGTYHIVVEPESDSEGSCTTIKGEGNKPSILKAAYFMITAYMNAHEGMTFADALKRLECLQRFTEDTCDTRVLKSIVPKGEEI